MAIASFASKVFQVVSNMVYTFDDLQYETSLQTEKQDVSGAKPSTYIKGPDLDTMSYKILIDSALGVNPRNEWGDWKRICSEKIAYPFVLAGVPLNNCKWLLTKVSPSNFRFNNRGNILSLELNLQFEEYVRPGSVKEKAGGTGSLSAEDEKKLAPSSPTPEEKSNLKRENPAMNLAMMNRVDPVKNLAMLNSINNG